MQYRYFSKRNQMTAVLKQDLHRLRSEHAGRLRREKTPVFRSNRAGDQIPYGVVLDVASTPPSMREIHALAWEKE